MVYGIKFATPSPLYQICKITESRRLTQDAICYTPYRVGKITTHDCKIMALYTVGRQKISKIFSYHIAEFAVIPSGYCGCIGNDFDKET